MAIKEITRRSFVNDMAAAGLAATIIPRHIMGRGRRSPNDTLNVACIGVGGMGRTDVRGMEVVRAIQASVAEGQRLSPPITIKSVSRVELRQ